MIQINFDFCHGWPIFTRGLIQWLCYDGIHVSMQRYDVIGIKLLRYDGIHVSMQRYDVIGIKLLRTYLVHVEFWFIS